jgi:hypothetical protein
MIERTIFFDHIHLVSSDPLAAARWYVEKLGGIIKPLPKCAAPPR